MDTADRFRGCLIGLAVGDAVGTSSGYVVRSLEAALWCFWNAQSFEEAILLAANLGDDADTTAVVCGQVSGAHYGESGIPERWRHNLAKAREIRSLADRLQAAAIH
jgi:ADP-ribosyl-[dinitrogen reductase] hydrolase